MHGDLIELYENALAPEHCSGLITMFESCGLARRGRTGGGLDLALKDSWDICLDDHAQCRGAVDLLNQAMMRALMAYVRRYPFTALAPLALRVRDAQGGAPRLLDPTGLVALPDEQLQTLLVQVFRPGTINLQKYVADVGGYPYWHCEAYPKEGDDSAEALHRVLLWSVYLNADFTAGETEFFHQGRSVTPRTGALLIAPAAFTHTHRGNRPEGGNKYIATSWVLFQRASVLFTR